MYRYGNGVEIKKRKGVEPRRRRPPRERRLKAGKMLQWSILSESPSSCAAKASDSWGGWSESGMAEGPTGSEHSDEAQ